MNQIGIRREDKNKWEKRVPLIPQDIKKLSETHQIHFVIQPSLDHRIYPDELYEAAGATISEDLSDCSVILGVKEIPEYLFQRNTAYVFFAHVIKGQSYNMPMLRSLMHNHCSLLDYEKIEDNNGRRLIFFGRHAGLAGMCETLFALSKHIELKALPNPFESLKQPFQYDSLASIKSAIQEIGNRITQYGLPDHLNPLICGFTGYGNVSKGAQEIYDLLPVTELDPWELVEGLGKTHWNKHKVYKVVFHEKHMFQPNNPQQVFDLQDYFTHPDLYHSVFSGFLPHLTLLVNCIYWTDKCPRLLTKDDAKNMYSSVEKPRLRVIGDISCDIDGSIEVTVKPTSPDNPFYVYNIETGTPTSDLKSTGPVVMAIDNLPCEIPREASTDFSNVFARFIPEIAKTDFDSKNVERALSPELGRALIVLNGELTESYKYIKTFLAKAKQE
ncbi:hypothetical protein JW979_04665 [bacterium]|nr:hypothetical protein [candidate division CSSED10-310 bacterium]